MTHLHKWEVNDEHIQVCRQLSKTMLMWLDGGEKTDSLGGDKFTAMERKIKWFANFSHFHVLISYYKPGDLHIMDLTKEDKNTG